MASLSFCLPTCRVFPSPIQWARMQPEPEDFLIFLIDSQQQSHINCTPADTENKHTSVNIPHSNSPQPRRPNLLVLTHTASCSLSFSAFDSLRTIDLVRFELRDQVLVHLHNRLLGLFILIQDKLGGDGTSHLRVLLHHDHLKNRTEQRLGSEKKILNTQIQRTRIN